MTTYTVTATREDGWWVLLADVGTRTIATQAKRLDQADEMAREAIAMALDVSEDSFDIDVHVDLGDELAGQLQRTKQVSEAAAAKQAEASARMRAMAHLLRDQGYTVRDAGRLMDVSSQRVSQLLAD